MRFDHQTKHFTVRSIKSGQWMLEGLGLRNNDSQNKFDTEKEAVEKMNELQAQVDKEREQTLEYQKNRKEEYWKVFDKSVHDRHERFVNDRNGMYFALSRMDEYHSNEMKHMAAKSSSQNHRVAQSYSEKMESAKSDYSENCDTANSHYKKMCELSALFGKAFTDLDRELFESTWEQYVEFESKRNDNCFPFSWMK